MVNRTKSPHWRAFCLALALTPRAPAGAPDSMHSQPCGKQETAHDGAPHTVPRVIAVDFTY
jgi:hypothetical protein